MRRMYVHLLIAVTVLAGSPAVANVAQWDFEGDLSSTTGGSELVPDFAAPEVAATYDFTVDPINGEDAVVATFSRGTFFRMTHGLPPNGGGVYVNQYTLLMDARFPDTGVWVALWQTNAANSNDGDWFVNPGGGLGISNNYGGLVGDGQWHRIALVFDSVAGTFTSFADGVQVQQNTGLAGADGRFSLDVTALLFADENQENAAGFVNSVQIVDRALAPAEIAALGGPTAAGLPLPTDPRDCTFRGFQVSYDPASNTVTGSWNLLPGDEGFRILEGARQVGGDLKADATTFTDTAPPVGKADAVYVLQPLVGGAVERSCEAQPVATYSCPTFDRLDIDRKTGKATLRWSPAVNLGVAGYEIIRDGKSIGSVDAAAVQYTDVLPEGPGTVLYRIVPTSLGAVLPCAGLYRSAILAAPSTIFFEDFEAYADDADLVAAGWEIHEEGTPSETCAWTITNPGRRGNPPLPDGSASEGKFIVSDSDNASGDDHQGSGMSHDIWSPPFSTAGMDVVWLHMDCSAVLNNNGEVVFDVDVTIDGGTTWVNVFRRVAPGRTMDPLPLADIPDGMDGGPQVGNADNFYGSLDLDLSAVAGEAEVRFRLRQFEPSDDWWIAVDDVRVDGAPAVGGSVGVLPLEAFDGGIPADWTVASLPGGTAPWAAADPCMLSVLDDGSLGILPDMNAGRKIHHLDTAFALAAYDPSCVPAVQDEWLETPVLDASSLAKVFLHFKSDILPTGAVAEVLLSLDGGKTFDAGAPVFSYSRAPGSLLADAGNPDVLYGSLVLDVPRAAGQVQVVFAFHYAKAAADQGFWAVDDVAVTGETKVTRPVFHRGDVNNDGKLDLSDPITLLGFLFQGGAAPACMEAANVNDDGKLDLSDPIGLLGFLFQGGKPPASPGPVGNPCGPDPQDSVNDLGCDRYTHC
jgi:hypothetical protein